MAYQTSEQQIDVLSSFMWKRLRESDNTYPLISCIAAILNQDSEQSSQPLKYIESLTPHEQGFITADLDSISTSHIYPLNCVQNQHGGMFIPVLWPAMNRWRMEHGLAYKPLHIALSASNYDRVDTSLSALRGGALPADWDRVDGVPVPPWAGVEALNALVMDCRMRSAPEEREWVRALVERWPREECSWARLGEWAQAKGLWKIMQGAFQAAQVRAGTEKRKEHYRKKILAAAGETEWGAVWTEEERCEVLPFTGKAAEELTAVWCMQVPETAQRCAGARSAQYVPMPVWWKLPKFFSWVVPFHLAGMSTPKGKGDIEALGRLGITNVITLTEEPLPGEWFSGSIRNTHVPVQNHFPPTVQQLDRALRMILEEPEQDRLRQGMTLVHCGGGKGRAGTILAAYIALFGFTPPGDEGYYDGTHDTPPTPPKMEGIRAVERLRSMRPGSIETEEQEKFVEKYVSLAWKRYGQGEPLYGRGGDVDEPIGVPLETSGDLNEPDVIVLVGVHGSGKSTFCKMAKIRNANVQIVSVDDVVSEGGTAGSASASRAYEGAVGRFKRSPTGQNPRKVLILDRCNPTPEERKFWTSLLTTPVKKIAIWFDYGHDHCRARVENRPSHPTLPPWRAKGAIESVGKMLKRPQLSEGFSGIARVRCIDNTRELADQIFGPARLLKFIRTKHLLNLGGATRDDLITPMQDLTRHISQHILVEEKIDGANLGISLSPTGSLLVQNRSHYVSAADQDQFLKLALWLEQRGAALRQVLSAGDAIPQQYTLYGEWMYAVHSIAYSHLPDWFVAFDLYDRVANRFLSRKELDARLSGTGISQVPVLYEGVFESGDMLKEFLDTKSRFSPEVKVEGIVVRFGGGERGKIVRGDFIAGNRHWSKNEFVANSVRGRDGGE